MQIFPMNHEMWREEQIKKKEVKCVCVFSLLSFPPPHLSKVYFDSLFSENFSNLFQNNQLKS